MMKQLALFVFCLICVLSFESVSVTAHGEEVRQIVFSENVKIDGVFSSIYIQAKYHNAGMVPNRPINVKIQSLGDLSAINFFYDGTQEVPRYGEDQAPVIANVDMQTDENGKVEIDAILGTGNYQIIVSYDDMEKYGWQPFIIPLVITGSCRVRPHIEPEVKRLFYRSGKEGMPVHVYVDSACKFEYLEQYFIEVNDGLDRSVIELEAKNPRFRYQSERIGTFPVVFSFSLSDDSHSKPKVTVSQWSPSGLYIHSSPVQADKEERTLYYYDTLIKPEPVMDNDFLTTKISYELTEEAKSIGFMDIVDFHMINLQLKICDSEKTSECVMLEWDKSGSLQNDRITFVTPVFTRGSIHPILYIGDTPYDNPLPVVKLPFKYARNGTAVLLIMVIILSIYFARTRKRAKSFTVELPNVPVESQLANVQLCRRFIRQCFEIVSKGYFSTPIDWVSQNPVSYYNRQISMNGNSNKRFENYCEYIASLLEKQEYTIEELETVHHYSRKYRK